MPSGKIYTVSVDTPKGPETVKVFVDKQTQAPQVIERKPTTIRQPEEPKEPGKTTVVVDQNTGFKTTTTTDPVVIKKDETFKQVQ